MVAAKRTVLAILAAGHSRRFGSATAKLDEDLWGKPLGAHVADALAPFPFLARAAITGSARLDYAARGYTVVPNTGAARDQSSSLRLAAGVARWEKAEALLIALADMPCVTAAHVARLLAAGDGPEALVASTDGAAAKPPALFGRAHYPALLAATGDHGARALIRSATLVPAPAADLVDVDTPAELAALRATRA